MTDKELHKAALKAMKATNLCLKHMKYHGQKFKDCTPEERMMIEIKGGKIREIKEEV